LKDGASVRFGNVRCTVRVSPDGFAAHIEVPFSLQDAVTTIGRDGVNDIVVSAPVVASRQAEIRWEKGRFVVYDVGADGGLFVSFSGDPSQERQVIQRNALKAGSTIRLGDVVFKLEEL
jgi:pSer/pThr/pTyr-binding forkhead associated (FHA) protein